MKKSSLFPLEQQEISSNFSIKFTKKLGHKIKRKIETIKMVATKSKFPTLKYYLIK